MPNQQNNTLKYALLSYLNEKNMFIALFAFVYKYIKKTTAHIYINVSQLVGSGLI